MEDRLHRGIEVKVRRGEAIDAAIKRLKRKVMREGTLKDLRAREYFVRPAERRRQKSKIARRRVWREQRESGGVL